MEYVNKENENKIRNILQKTMKYAVRVCIVDTEQEEESFALVNDNNIDKILDYIDGGDEMLGLNFYDFENKYIGWVNIMPYEDDVVQDCSDNEFCLTITEE